MRELFLSVELNGFYAVCRSFWKGVRKVWYFVDQRGKQLAYAARSKHFGRVMTCILGDGSRAIQYSNLYVPEWVPVRGGWTVEMSKRGSTSSSPDFFGWSSATLRSRSSVKRTSWTTARDFVHGWYRGRAIKTRLDSMCICLRLNALYNRHESNQRQNTLYHHPQRKISTSVSQALVSALISYSVCANCPRRICTGQEHISQTRDEYMYTAWLPSRYSPLISVS